LISLRCILNKSFCNKPRISSVFLIGFLIGVKLYLFELEKKGIFVRQLATLCPLRLHSADEFPISIERVNLDLPPVVFFFFINQEFVAVKSETLFSIIIFLVPSIKNVRSKGDACQTIC
jgi:hypothetical protein